MYIQKNTPLPPFVPLPKFILRTGLSLNAKLLYGLLLNRSTLSQKNNWADERGRVYVTYTVREMAEDLDRGISTVKTSLKELENAGLLLRRRMGLTKANRLFVLLPDSLKSNNPDGQKTTYPDSRKAGCLDGLNLATNDTDIERTDRNDTEGESALPRLGHYKNIVLTEGQQKELEKDFPGRLEGYIEKLSSYMVQTGKSYTSHEAVLRRWLMEDKPSARTGAYTDADYEEGDCL